MSYLVLARKYRPQRFGEMAGQEHVVRTIANAIARGQLAHAFLFTGPRGVGKTTAARLVAKAVNCERGPTAEPCGACVACVEIAEGRAVDVVEIDAASNNGVDNVRDIVEAVKYRPARDRFKVFVVDEVHMLSTGAFNALLKTLEEPPPHVKFVLATTDVHKVPETIVSRCQRFDFRRLSQQQIVDQLAKVAAAEGLAVTPSALALVARSAEGGMRDALSLLDQVRAAGGDAPDDAAVAEALGAIDPASIGRIGAGLVRRDGAAVLAELEALHERGQEMKRVAEELVRHLRNVVVAKLVPAAPLDLPDMELREVRGQAEAAPATQLARLFDVVQAAVTEVKQAEQPRFALEVALLKGCFLAPGEELREVVARLEQLAAGAPPPPRRSQPPASISAPPPASPARTVAKQPAPPSPPARAEPAPPSPRERAEPSPPPSARAERRAPQAPGVEAPTRAAISAPPPPVALAGDPAERWRALVEAVDAQSAQLGAALKQALLVSFGDGEVAIRIAPSLHARTIQTKKAEIEAAFARALGKPARLTATVGELPADAPAIAAPVAQAERAEREARSRDVQAAARNHPRIQEAAKILGGEIDRTDEL